MKISKDEVEKVQEGLDQDFQTLFRLVITHDTPVLEGDVRAASVILRKWISDGWISKLGNALGASVTLPILDNEESFNALSTMQSVEYFLTGGIRFNGKAVRGIYYSSDEPELVLPLLKIDRMRMKLTKPGGVCNQKRLYFKGEIFTCDEIIKFMANKLGGAHFNFSRDAKSGLLEEASKFMTFGGPRTKITKEPPGELYLEMEPNGTEIQSGLSIEVIAAAASLLNVHFDGKPYLEFEKEPSGLLKKLMNRLRRKRFNPTLHFKEMD